MNKWEERFDKTFGTITYCIDDVCDNCHNNKPCLVVDDIKSFISQELKKRDLESIMAFSKWCSSQIPTPTMSIETVNKYFDEEELKEQSK